MIYQKRQETAKYSHILQLCFSKSKIFKLWAGLVNQFFTQLASENCRFFAQQGQETENWFQIVISYEC